MSYRFLGAATQTMATEQNASASPSGGGSPLVQMDARLRQIAKTGTTSTAVQEAAKQKTQGAEQAIAQQIGFGPFARPAYCADFADTRYRAAPAIAPAGSVVVMTGQLNAAATPQQGQQWAQAILANALYVVGYRRAYERAARPWELGSDVEPTLIPVDAGFELSSDGRFKTAWVALFVARPTKTSVIRAIIGHLGVLASSAVFGHAGQWLAVPYVLEQSADFKRLLATASTLSQHGYFRPGDPIPTGALPSWLPPQHVPELGRSSEWVDGVRPADPAGATRLAISWEPTGLLAKRPFWLLAHLERRVRDTDWMSWDGSFAERAPDGRILVGVIVSVAPAKLSAKTVADLESQLDQWAHQLDNKNGNELRSTAANDVQRISVLLSGRAPTAAQVPPGTAPWGRIKDMPAGVSCIPAFSSTTHAPAQDLRANQCGVDRPWNKLQRDASDIWQGYPWGYGALIRQQPVPSGGLGLMTRKRTVPFGVVYQLGYAFQDLPQALRIPTHDGLTQVALQAEGVIADFAVIMQGMLGGIASAQRQARRVLQDAEVSRNKLTEALQISGSVASLRSSLTAAAQQFLGPSPDFAAAATFFAEAKGAVSTMRGKVAAALELAQTRVWLAPEQAYAVVVQTLQNGVREVDQRFHNAPPKIRDRLRCFYLEKAEQQLGPMTQSLRADLEQLPTLSEQVRQAAPGALTQLDQLLAELENLERQVGIPWYLKRYLGLPAYGWAAGAGLLLVGAAGWAASRKKKKKPATMTQGKRGH